MVILFLKLNKMRTCVQCHRRLGFHVDLEVGPVPSVCVRPDCPNYGVLAICQEEMPDNKEIVEEVFSKKELEDAREDLL